MRPIRKQIDIRAFVFLLLIAAVIAGAFAGFATVAQAAGQNRNQSGARMPVHHRKHISVSCRQLCEASYDECKASGKKKGIHSCKRVYAECLSECTTGQ